MGERDHPRNPVTGIAISRLISDHFDAILARHFPPLAAVPTRSLWIMSDRFGCGAAPPPQSPATCPSPASTGRSLSASKRASQPATTPAMARHPSPLYALIPPWWLQLLLRPSPLCQRHRWMSLRRACRCSTRRHPPHRSVVWGMDCTGSLASSAVLPSRNTAKASPHVAP